MCVCVCDTHTILRNYEGHVCCSYNFKFFCQWSFFNSTVTMLILYTKKLAKIFHQNLLYLSCMKFGFKKKVLVIDPVTIY